jgi:predicted acetyltransferase
VRGVRHVDADGVVRGAMAYVITRDDADIAAARLDISHLVAESAAAENALWGFALQHDLVSQVTARLRPLDDTIRWLVRDERGAVQTTRDHGWLRILDLPLALEARTYAAAADVVLEVSDPLGLTTGTWRLAIDAEGVATVTTADGEEPDLRLGIAELSASYLGGTPLAGLHAAGRVTGDEEAAAALTVAQRPARPPHLSIWY